LLGGALGPLLSSFLVGSHGVRSALFLAAGLIVSGVAMMVGLHLAVMRSQTHRQLAVLETVP